MSVQFDATRSKYVVRWREDGRQRTRRFAHQPEAMAFDATVNPNGRTSRRDADSEGRRTAVTRVAELESERDRDKRDGVYPYATKQGVRWRIVFRQSDATLSFRRGFTSRTAAATARRRLQDSDERGEVKDSREDIAAFWTRFVADRRAYMTAGSHLDLITHGHRRLVPFLGAERVSKIDEDRVREWMALMVDHVEAGELSPKTVNNARTHLSVAFNEAVRRGLMTRNPCTFVPALLVQRTEIEYLRLAEIDPYLRACADHYAVLAAFSSAPARASLKQSPSSGGISTSTRALFSFPGRVARAEAIACSVRPTPSA